ncbi:Ribonuclease HII [Planktothrix sp. PCC 11201]|uniref:ribonuclease HII n=1 Tax=Planktothrix sp. PCC 11201 TaxID=1729650 RepID=UPI000915086C|nr:ribonuclease HII [Planktothrix sp. PCC 11201]SKB11811.1 Ribonuclease HII [Planktothrix sp. PCC 11201]
MTEYQALTSILIAGVDEVGRGALFGPVVAAAVILSEDGMAQLTSAGVKDSKKLTPGIRSRLAIEIKAIAIDCKIGWASVKEIDRFNILQATLLAMKRAILRLNPQPELCLIDGNQKIPQLLIPQQTIIKGDSTSIAIAAASIVAKVWRDQLITRLAKKYPEYDLKQNKGYGTAKHRQAIQDYGITCQHRQSFGCCQLSLPLSN